MIRKSASRFSEKIVLNNQVDKNDQQESELCVSPFRVRSRQ
jgi:hypothetical protein